MAWVGPLALPISPEGHWDVASEPSLKLSFRRLLCSDIRTRTLTRSPTPDASCRSLPGARGVFGDQLPTQQAEASAAWLRWVTWELLLEEPSVCFVSRLNTPRAQHTIIGLVLLKQAHRILFSALEP